jgi:ketosteroid isomerase-like protein
MPVSRIGATHGGATPVAAMVSSFAPVCPCWRKEQTMTTRRTLLLGCSALAISLPSLAQDRATEASLREAIKRYVAAWNSHDVQAWSAFLTDDIWYTEAIDYYQRMKGRQAVLAFFGDTVKTSDIVIDVQQVKMMPDGTATVVVRHVSNILPKSADKYASSFESLPSLTRWRLEGDRWRMFYFTSHKGSALDAMQKDGMK